RMSERSIRAAVASPRTASTTLSSCLPLAAACIATTRRPTPPLWHSSLPPVARLPCGHALTEQRAPQSLHPARARCGCEARRHQHRYLVAAASAAHRRLGGAAPRLRPASAYLLLR